MPNIKQLYPKTTPLQQIMEHCLEKLTLKEMKSLGDKYGLELAKEFVIKRHPKNKDAILIGTGLRGKTKYLIYKDEKTGKIITDPEYFIQIIKTKYA